MGPKIISFDLGTGGNKATLYDTAGNCLASAFVPYPTQYPQVGHHEQRPADWWSAVVNSSRQLMESSGVNKNDVECLGISGHSLGAVPLDRGGTVVREYTPIWSDLRAGAEAQKYFERVDPADWYSRTGNGFPAALYTIFKIMWYRDHEPEMFDKVRTILGTKDYINYRLTGKIATDHSYASGSGVYELKRWQYSDDLIQGSGVPRAVLPEIVPSTQVLGDILPEVAAAMGLGTGVKVVCGGVDNSCMALGAGNTREGRVYTSLGSAAWIAVSSRQPVLDDKYRPFVFAHVVPGLFTSAVSIFSAGTSFRWVKDNLCSELISLSESTGTDVYAMMDDLAEKAPVGSNRLLFNPSLAGGTSQDPSVHIRGAYLGLDLKHGKPELIRAAMEGIAMNLRLRLDLLRKYCELEDEILFVGGGAKSRTYLGIFADAFNTRIRKTSIDQDAGALGAGAIAAVGCGLWDTFEKVDDAHKTLELIEPREPNAKKYEQLLPIFQRAAEYQAALSDALYEVDV